MRSHDWITLTISEAAFRVGDWSLARDSLGPSASRVAGNMLMFRQLREAELALGVGDEDAAEACLSSVEELVCESSEPQWIALYGLLVAELRRRRHDYDGARAAVENALGRIEICTDDVNRIARVAAAGTRIEADRAQRARDLGEKAELREALTRCRLHVSRLEAAAQEGGPSSERISLRARPRWPALGVAVAREWAKAVDRVGGGPAAISGRDLALARGRGAGDGGRPCRRRAASRGARDRQRAGLEVACGRDPRPSPSARGSTSAAEQASANGADAAAEQDPFGLTPRERQVLALVARAPPTARSARRCSWPRRPPASTSRGSSPSSGSRDARRRRRSRTAGTSTELDAAATRRALVCSACARLPNGSLTREP